MINPPFDRKLRPSKRGFWFLGNREVNGVTAKQKQFIVEFLVDRNATQAAIRAGYSKDTARQMGAENLSKPYIKAAIDEKLKQLESERVADAQEILEFHTSVLRGEADGEELVTVAIGDGMSEVQKVQKKPSVRDKQKSAECLAKLLGIEKNKLEVSGSLKTEASKLGALVEQMNSE